ncbi:partial 4-alpha-glucanotransferase, partial [Anaerolineae bacterium]
MAFKRASGVLLHPTSLPGRHGIGDLGEAAYIFIDFLVASKQSIWQVLPLGPTGYGDSPYQCFSAFAGNPMLINLDRLVEEGLLTANDVVPDPTFSYERVNFGPVIAYKTERLKRAYEKFKTDGHRVRRMYDEFIQREASWLNDYALF